MAKLRITPNGTVLESEIFLTNETFARLTNPENTKQIKAALLDFGKVSHRIEESDKNVSIMSRPIGDGENIEPVLEKLFKTHTEFIDWAQSLPALTPIIDFKDEDDSEEAIKNMVKDVKEILSNNPVAVETIISFKKGTGLLWLTEPGIKALFTSFVEKYDKEEESL